MLLHVEWKQVFKEDLRILSAIVPHDLRLARTHHKPFGKCAEYPGVLQLVEKWVAFPELLADREAYADDALGI